MQTFAQYTNWIMEFVWFLKNSYFKTLKTDYSPVNRTPGTDHRVMGGKKKYIEMFGSITSPSIIDVVKQISHKQEWYNHTRHTVRTSTAIIKLQASQMNSIKINNEKLVVLNRIESNRLHHWIESFSFLANCPSLVLTTSTLKQWPICIPLVSTVSLSFHNDE